MSSKANRGKKPVLVADPHRRQAKYTPGYRHSQHHLKSAFDSANGFPQSESYLHELYQTAIFDFQMNHSEIEFSNQYTLERVMVTDASSPQAIAKFRKQTPEYVLFLRPTQGGPEQWDPDRKRRIVMMFELKAWNPYDDKVDLGDPKSVESYANTILSAALGQVKEQARCAFDRLPASVAKIFAVVAAGPYWRPYIITRKLMSPAKEKDPTYVPPKEKKRPRMDAIRPYIAQDWPRGPDVPTVYHIFKDSTPETEDDIYLHPHFCDLFEAIYDLNIDMFN